MSRVDKASRIPVGTQFSPNLIDLREFVKAALGHSGDPEGLKDAIATSPVRIRPYSRKPSRRMQSLPLEAAVQYGLLTPSQYEATSLAKRLSLLHGAELYEEFARHILFHLGGLRVVEAAQQMHLDGQEVTGDSLASYLSDQGFRVTVHNTAINTMRMWLAAAGLFPKAGRKAGAWRPDLAVKERLLQIDDATLAALTALTDDQQSFTKALCRVDPKGWTPAAEIRDLAEAADGVRIGRGSLPNEVLRPLKAAGLIEYRTRGTRGGKSSQLVTTDRFRSDVLLPFLSSTIKDLDPALSAYYRTRPVDIYADLESDDMYVRGRALEAFSILIMRLIGLRFVGWRRRAKETGYSEVDVQMAGLFGAVPTTWQVQCKNTPSGIVRLDDVAKEVGLLPLTRATHIMLFANAKITRDAKRYANAIMRHSSVSIFLLDADDFEAIRKRPASLGSILRAQGEHIRDVKMSLPVWQG